MKLKVGIELKMAFYIFPLNLIMFIMFEDYD